MKFVIQKNDFLTENTIISGSFMGVGVKAVLVQYATVIRILKLWVQHTLENWRFTQHLIFSITSTDQELCLATFPCTE